MNKSTSESTEVSVARHFIFNACVTEHIHTSVLFKPPIKGYEKKQLGPKNNMNLKIARHVHAFEHKTYK